MMRLKLLLPNVNTEADRELQIMQYGILQIYGDAVMHLGKVPTIQRWRFSLRLAAPSGCISPVDLCAHFDTLFVILVV